MKSENLFTFGQQKLKNCLDNVVAQQKFQFMTAKVRKSPLLLRQFLSQQRQKINFVAKQDSQSKIIARVRTFSQQANRKQLMKENMSNMRQSLGTKSTSSKQKKKLSLPKVVQNIFPDPCANFKRKVTVFQPVRYGRGIKSLQLGVNLLQSCEFQSQSLRAQSLMFLGEEAISIPENKAQTIQPCRRGRLASKMYCSKQEHRYKAIACNSRIVDTINQFKKLYC